MTEKIINPMRRIKIEKVIFKIGGLGDELEKGLKLIELLTGRKACKTKARKRVPAFGTRPGLEIGAIVTIRKNPIEILKKMLVAKDNLLKKKQISKNQFSFGIKEYIEIPGIEYQREIGIRGFDVNVVFKRAGKKVKIKKVKKGKIPKRQHISKEEIIKFMEENFQTKFI